MQDAMANRPHGLMFHHFHGTGFAPSQGSIDADTFEHILAHYAQSHRVLDADEYLQRALSGELGPRDVCITFDDSLLCQYDVALPVLERHGLHAFWFIYSGVIAGRIEPLEVYRRYRSEYFDDIDGFYAAFFKALARSPHADTAATALCDFVPRHYLAEFPFYTDNDRRFRYLRDIVLSSSGYDDVMTLMMDASGTSATELAEGLWIGAEQLRMLHQAGHVIGLHSHTHPTMLAALPADLQLREYTDNQQILANILGATPNTMSHPCNSYDDVTLDGLRSLGIELGFRSNMSPAPPSALEHPREDHANIVKRLGLCPTSPAVTSARVLPGSTERRLGSIC